MASMGLLPCFVLWLLLLSALLSTSSSQGYARKMMMMASQTGETNNTIPSQQVKVGTAHAKPKMRQAEWHLDYNGEMNSEPNNKPTSPDPFKATGGGRH